MPGSVREYAILYVGPSVTRGSAGGGNVMLNAGQHALDGPEHTGQLPADRVSVEDAGGFYAGDDAEAALQEIGAHPGDATDAHDASAISFAPAGTIAATDVQAAIAEVASEAAADLAAHAALGGGTDHLHIDNLAFSGDGSTTVFELPAAPFDAYSVGAYVAGLRTAITLSGAMLTTMTFGSAPASGTDNITVDVTAALA